MNKDIERLGEVRLLRHKRRNIWLAAVVALCVVVLAFSLYHLIKPASAVTRDLTPYLTAVSSNGGVTYDPINDYYIGDSIEIDFKLPAGTLTSSSKEFSYTYPSGIEMDSSILNTEYTLYDSNGITAGTYEFQQNSSGTYSVIISFNDKYVTNLGSGSVSGSVYFAGIFGKNTVIEEEKIYIRFTDDLVIDIPLEKVNQSYDLTVNKSNQLSSDKKSVSYTVLAYSASGTPGTVDFEDVLKVTGSDNASASLKEIVVHPVLVKADSTNSTYTIDSVSSETVSYTNEYISNGTIRFQLPQLEAGEVQSDGSLLCNGYQITYVYDLSVPVGKIVTGRNDVKVSSSDSDTGKYVEDSDSSSFQIDNRLTVSKSGYNSNNRGMWTIYVNSNRINIAGMKLTDDMFNGYDIQDFKIYPNEGYQYTYNSAGELTGIEFKAISNGQNTNYYTITYNTALASDTDPTVNTVSIEGESSSATVYPDNGDPGESGSEEEEETEVTKTATSASVSADLSTLTIGWTTTVTITENGIAKGTVIKDVLSHWQNGCIQYFSYDQLNSIFATLSNTNPWATKTTNYKVYALPRDFSSWDKEYKWSDITEDFCNQYYVVGFSFELAEDITLADGNNFAFTYYSNADIVNSSDKLSYTNKITIGDITKEASYYYQRATFKKTNGDGSEEETEVVNDSGELTWKVSATLDSLNDYESTTITDYLPSGVELSDVNITVSWMSKDITDIPTDGTEISGQVFQWTTDGNILYTLSYDKETRKIVITLRRKSGDALDPSAAIAITYHCKVNTSDISNYRKGNKYSFTNYATIQMGDLILDDSQTQWWKENYEVVSKNGTWDDVAQRIHYSIKINEEADDLIPGSDHLTFDDVLSYAIEPDEEDRDVALVQDTVKLYSCTVDEDGNVTKTEITDWSWEYNSTYYSAEVTGDVDRCANSITATIPDSTYLIFEYDYILTGNLESVDNPTLGVKNTASISGTYYTSTDNKEEYEWSKATHGAIVSSTYHYTFYKVEKGNYGKALSGAVFTLYEYTDGKSDVDTKKTYITNEYGTFAIYHQGDDTSAYQFKMDTLYYVKETTPPEGYQLPTEEVRYYFYFDDDGSMTLPSGISAVNLWTHGKTEYVINDIKPVSIEVNKVWLDGDGNETTDVDVTSIYVDLHRVDTYYDEEDESAARDTVVQQNVEIVPGDDHSWHYVFENLDRYTYHEVNGVQTAFECLYYVTERSVAGYEWITLEQSGISIDTAITSGTVTLKNQAVTYVLPATGGLGLPRWTICIGIAFILITIIGLIYKEGKEKEITKRRK
ncbi:MAG: hypothetical protein E7282_10590 [Lachnospiraceae bacterium]|nr:hypothetical protein [Lachnospiraceae bacterium]